MIRKDIIDLFRVPAGKKLRLKDHNPGWKQSAEFEELGFETRFDADVNVDFRWIDMAPPGGGTTLSVVATTDALPTGVDTGIRFLTPDARAAHARLMDLGLRVGELLDWPTAPLMFEFWDADGNTMYVAEAE